MSWFQLRRKRSQLVINLLEVSVFLSPSCEAAVEQTPTALYHHGNSAAGGHYTLDVLHPNRYPSSLPNAKAREGWVRIDDELVSDVRPDDVFRTPEKDDMRCAYLLFYRRI